MPIYEYECAECGRFETMQKINEQPLDLCPTCNEHGKSSHVRRVVSLNAFHLKGGGWYKTDYAGSSSSTTKSSSRSSSSDATSKADSGASDSGSSDTATAKKCNTGCGCH
jgi:putative FmdB family regulatory protein